MNETRSYGQPKRSSNGGFYLQACVRSDVWDAIQQLRTTHSITVSGAAHHLMRLGAGLKPLPPLDTND